MDKSSAPWDTLLRAVARADDVDPATLGPSIGELLTNKYRVDAVLGAGGIGTVYAATELATGRELAIKWLHRAYREDHTLVRRLKVEAQAAFRIDHPNVLKMHSIETHESTTYLTMERLHGETLAQLVKREGPLPATAAVALLLPVVRGTAAAHDAGVVHRDLKPHNILLAQSANGVVPKVLDFGLSKLFVKLPAQTTLTAAGAMMGTLEFMSPEQARDAKAVDERSDVYSLGAVLYYATSGRVPYDLTAQANLLRAVMEGRTQPLGLVCPTLDPAFVALVTRAMAPEPGARFADCHMFARSLETLSPTAIP